MNAEQNRAKSIFLNAAEIAVRADQEAYIAVQCGDDAALRREVAELLAHHAPARAFLEAPAAQRAATLEQPGREHPGTVIGPYKLLQQIGEGGMGVVWMAEQTQPVQRKVALKVIKPGMDSRQVIARFEAERQALAMMDHVSIARVFDGGATEAGRPYFVMELVHGVPITKYCDDNHLTPRERLELFVPVCQAIQHAHQKGIIHRDIKPSNVMITLYDGKPVPKVIDFGVAKATEQKLTERTLFTQYGTMVGTLEYMSPEQAEMSALGVDTRSDIYSLGVLLYELLTGSTPLTHKRMKEAAYAEILRMIKEEEPPKPSTRLSDSGEALASISALRHTEPAKLTKLVRGELDWIVMKTLEKDRNRRYETPKDFAADVQRYLNDEPVLACPPSALYRLRKFARRNKRALAVAGLVLFFIVLLGGGAGWAVRDRTVREETFARERALKQTAVEQEVNLALKEAERLQEQAKWPEALSAAKRAEGLLAGGGSDELRERVQPLRKDLEMVLRLEEIRLLSSEWKDDKFDHETADRVYAQAFGDYGIDVAGLPMEEAAARIRERAGVAVALTTALDYWAFSRSRKDKAGGLALTVLAQSADPDPWRRQVRQAVKQNDTKALAALAASPELLRQPPTSFLYLAGALRASGLAEAHIELMRQAQRQYPGDFWINYDLAATLREMGHLDRDEAVSFLRAALAVRPQSTAVHNNLGIALFDQKKLDEAIIHYRKAIELDPKFVRAHSNLGNALAAQKKLDEAIDCYRTAIAIDPKYSMAHCALGGALRDQRKFGDAVVAYRNAIEHDPKLVIGHLNLGALLCDHLRDYENAAACFRKAIELDPKNAEAHANLGNALKGQRKLDAAIAEYREAIGIGLKNDPARVHYLLGVALGAKGQPDDSIAEYREAIRLKKDYAMAHYGLGVALGAKGQQDDSIAEFREAIRLKKDLPEAHYILGLTLHDKRQLDAAIAQYREAIGLKKDHALAHYSLGVALRDKGQLDVAITKFREAILLKKDFAKAHYSLGLALAAKGQPDDAIAEFREVIHLKKDDPEAHYSLGLELHNKGQQDDAITEYREAIRLKPDYAEAHTNLGTALANKGQLDAAIAEYREAIRIKKDLPEAHNALGRSLARKGQMDDAIAAFKEAIRLNPQSAPARNNFGAYLCDELKDHDKAIECFRKAIELDPKYVDAHNNLGIVLSHQGKIGEAIASYTKSLELDPRNAVAFNSLADLLATCPDVKFRDPARAVALAKKAVELAPKEGAFWNTLGVAHYRAGNWKEAIAALDKSMTFLPGQMESFNTFFLAMAHWKDGNKVEARKWHHKAIEWMEKNLPRNEDLRRFRTEAEELMGVKEKKM